MLPDAFPPHGLAREIIEMVRGQLDAAISTLKDLPAVDDGRRVTAVLVMLEEVLPEFTGPGLKPWRAIPWLACASHLLHNMGAADVGRAREHVSAARELLTRD